MSAATGSVPRAAEPLPESANLELVRSIFVGWERGDFSSTSWAGPEIVMEFVDGPEQGTYSGPAEMSRVWGEFLHTWQDLRAVPDHYRELDDGRILVTIHNTGRGKASGMKVDSISQRTANMFEIDSGKVKRLTVWWDVDRALADLGLTS